MSDTFHIEDVILRATLAGRDFAYGAAARFLEIGEPDDGSPDGEAFKLQFAAWLRYCSLHVAAHALDHGGSADDAKAASLAFCEAVSAAFDGRRH